MTDRILERASVALGDDGQLEDENVRDARESGAWQGQKRQDEHYHIWANPKPGEHATGLYS